ncbi:MAG: hypothetical protein MZV64_64200 [Ignavibacteriales bacterium]|nr:hypothetical protein [Ignavibacteriales bacterium]
MFEKLMGLLRRDILVGNSEYQDILHEMTGLACDHRQRRSTSTPPGATTQTLGDPVRLLGHDLRAEDVHGGAAPALRGQPEPAREPAEPRPLQGQPAGRPSQGPDRAEGDLPILSARVHPQDRPAVLTVLMSAYNQRPDVIADGIMTVFEFFRREEPVDIEPIKRAYADCGASVHFLYLTRPAPRVPGVAMEEQSEDIFAPFREMSLATGGYIASTANIGAAMKSAVAASENYYLLYYTPKDYKADGGYRKLDGQGQGRRLPAQPPARVYRRLRRAGLTRRAGRA